jgi:anti-sigma-K factor RskA
VNRLPTSQHDDFDRSLRQLQRHAEGAVSPATLARLRQARQQATAAPESSPWRRRGWWLATACSAVLAVTVAVQFNRTAPVLPASVAADAADELSDDTLLFDESPELYLWLGADTVAME